MVKGYVGLGTNQGDKLDNLRKALEILGQQQGIRVCQVASVYETEPVGYLEQDWFYNTVAEIETTLSPQELLGALLMTESRLGRVRTIRWGPRLIDLDLLLYGGQAIREENLEVPHPRMLERAFVMGPLAELAPELTMRGKTSKEYFENLKNIQKISCIKFKI